MQHITSSAFDADAFGVPFYRVHAFDGAAIRKELQAIREQDRSFIVDAKVPAEDVENSRLLWSLGFRKVCMQITLRHDLSAADASPSGTTLAARLELAEALLHEHAANFTLDRFSLDPLIARDGTRRLYANWIRNSLTGGRKDIVHAGTDFCTLAVKDNTASIDLVSVLTHGRGIGRQLVAGAVSCARERGAKELFVTTECENPRAWRLYMRAGFLPARFTAAFHLVQQ
jgi:GNAT superfamily N-acetyltransferase